jgi:DNA-binding transcriptional MocR family regulator
MVNVSAHKYIRGASAVEIARSIERGIREGRLAEGERLPTVRGLADQLGVSPATVAAAYRGLRQRGLLQAQGRRGTLVRSAPPQAARVPAAVPPGVRDLANGNPDPLLLPDLAGPLRSIDTSAHLYGRDLYESRLLDGAARRFRADDIPAQHLAVVSGALDGLERVLTAHLRPGDRVAVEDPGFTNVLDLVATLGLAPVPVALDDSGPLPDALERALRSDVAALIVTPRAQNPFGAALDEGRARELRRILRAFPDVLILEDDHAADVSGARAYSLCTRSRARFAVVRSVSKSLGPDLRLALISGDAETIGRVEGRQYMGMRWVSHLLQRTVVALWSDRAVARRLREAERTYATRRSGLLRALAGHGISAHGRSGLNVWVPVPDELAIATSLLERGWAVTPGARFRSEAAPAIRVTIATLEPADAQRFAAELALALEPPARSATT